MAEQGFLAVGLWVLADNLPAIRFYLVAGFSPEAGGARMFEMGGRALQEVHYVAAIGGDHTRRRTS